ncbi:bifunctional ADP-dependent NAD(P)H-hydrate dehydratase/NAD(P)H-hydrate epimerase [Fictibacillus gelatini]|uniref:bifunctional ADP-dependent NAD(P)H-hydrate dehydratase/NAD(P)H-hydrate epimerase n=1 Tax=Fictibacillus gelatini TaxID=225985 RepID=UPI000417A025|nr:bifunctional ADP-dependent NAD(P)H-hydrate dehydratase/NAD(P)H-hydrate epimerase [Fictibacillus gelatini]
MQIVTKDEMYAIDRFTMERIGMAEEMLMENAGQAVSRKLMDQVSKNEKIAVLIGTGNNGGDGFVIARALKSHGYDVDSWLIPPKEKIRGAAQTAMAIYENAGYLLRNYTEEGHAVLAEEIGSYTVIIDALLGIGVQGKLRPPYKEIITLVNKADAEIISVDLPSGVPADGGPVDEAVQADWTLTLQCPKMGAFTFPARTYYGKMEVVDIGIPPLAVQHLGSQRAIWEEHNVIATLPKRTQNSHKGSYGKGLVIGGSRNMTGAPLMTAKAALRSGAGLLTVAVPETVYPMIASQMAEAMYWPSPDENGHFKGELKGDLTAFTAVAAGPGMGREKGARSIIETVLSLQVPVVIDADGLYHLSSLKERLNERTSPTILTPHSGEMARLIGCSADDVEKNRFGIARDFAVEYGVYVVLKGPYTIVTTPEGSQFVNTTGNAALAKGGSGDVLTGIILSFMMQGEDIQSAVSNAVYVHGKTADVLLQEGHSLLDVIATDVIESLPPVLHYFSNSFRNI